MTSFLGAVVFSCIINHNGDVEITSEEPPVPSVKLCLCNPKHGPAVRAGRCTGCNERRNAARRVSSARRVAA